MQHLITQSRTPSLPLHLLTKKEYSAWLKRVPSQIKDWLETSGFAAKDGAYAIYSSKGGILSGAIAIIPDDPNIWSIAHLPSVLPDTAFHLDSTLGKPVLEQLCLGWLLGGYQFKSYKKMKRDALATLKAPQGVSVPQLIAEAASLNHARDLVNTPANDMNPTALAKAAIAVAKKHNAKCEVILGAALEKENYPLVFAVGKASADAPRLVDIRYGRKGAPKVTLVGKGVCFDSGGLDIKSSSNMKLMKKDMGGAAAALALADIIMTNKLDVQLRVLLPIVENAISGNAMRPSDIIKSRKGITVEIGNTDAEGRLILCDALYEADQEKPDLLIDFATLTGAARVALGPEVPAYFTPDDALADGVFKHAKKMHDPMWRLPLWQPYRDQLNSRDADISNDPESSYGGAITAALYLQEFIEHTKRWLHIDMMAWNMSNKPGRPQGGEAQCVRALFSYIKEHYGKH